MYKNKIVIYGLGKIYKEYRDRLYNNADVVAASDTYLKKSNESNYIEPKEILKCEYNWIVICSRIYYDSIRMSLFQIGISLEKMISIDEYLKLNHDENRFREVIDDKIKYLEQNQEKKFDIQDENLMLIETDKNETAGRPCTHYFAQDIWVAKQIYNANPQEHYDIGSRLDGFIAHMLCFRRVNYIDIRPLPFKIDNLNFCQGDATNLCNIKSNSIESLSCLHALEHFGLGRYGDLVDPEGYIKAAKEFQRIIRKGGKIYISVPIGPKNKLVFNAHRIFEINTIVELFDRCTCEEIRVIDPDGVTTHAISSSEYDEVLDFSCGIFIFIKAK